MKQLMDYLDTMIRPPGGTVLVSETVEGLNLSSHEDESVHGIVVQGQPTEEEAAEMMRVLVPGAHVMCIAPEDKPAGYESTVLLEETGFEVRDSICYLTEAEGFLYTSKASRAEREAGCHFLPAVSGAEATDRKEGSAGLDNPRAGAGRTASNVRNFHPCLHPDALVMTEWGYRPIQEIRKGDMVYSADGCFHEVEHVSHHPYTSPNLFEIDVRGTNLTTLASDNHPFLIWRPERKRRQIVGGEVLWVEASEIRKGDYTMTPVLSESPHPGVSDPLPEICSTPGFWFLFGLYLAEGSELSGASGHSYPGFSLHEDESELISRIEQFAVVRGNTFSVYPRSGRSVHVVLFDGDCWKAFHKLGGKLSHQKSLHPLIWNLPQEVREEICEGHMAGDGGNVRTWKQAKTVSPSMASQLRLLAESTGVKVNLHRNVDETPRKIEGREIQSFKPVYTMRWYEKDAQMEGRKPSGPVWKMHDGIKYRVQHVSSVREIPYEGDVWNLSVKGSPTFQTSVGMSHNTVKSIEIMEWCFRDVPQGLVVEPFMGSGTTLIAATRTGHDVIGIEMNPEYAAIADARVRHWANQDIRDTSIWIDSEAEPEVEEAGSVSFLDLAFGEEPVEPSVEIRNQSGDQKLTLWIGDCVERMEEIESDSVTAIVSDPPYGLKFMNKEFDDLGEGSQQREWHIRWLEQAYRILKPGGVIKAFSGCYDKETEVLTERGWVPFPEVTKDDLFASLNPSTHEVEWLPPIQIIQEPHDGPMLHCQSNRVDLLVTPNHKMFVASLGNPKGHQWRLVRADETPSAVHMTLTSQGRSDADVSDTFTLPPVTHSIGPGGMRERPELNIPWDVWCAFFGLWIAEGSASISSNSTGSSTKVKISHFNMDNLYEIKEKLEPWFNVCVYEKHGCACIHDPRLYAYLKQFGHAHEKYLPAEIKRLPPKYLKILIEWYVRGDGDARWCGYTASPQLRDDFQEVALYAGWAARTSVRPDRFKFSSIDGREIVPQHPQYTIQFIRTQVMPRVGFNRTTKESCWSEVSAEEWGGQEVFCVELERNHTLYVRRNGKSVWCGNSRTYHHLAAAMAQVGFTGPNDDQVQVEAWVYGCLSEDSEILTQDGWKPGLEVKVDENVACWDSDSGEINMQPVQGVTRAPYKGELIRLHSHMTDQLLTPNHRVYHKLRGGKVSVLRADEIHFLSTPVQVPVRNRWGVGYTQVATSTVLYDGMVWCVKVPTGAFVARREGQVFITGNSGFPKSLNISKAIDKHLGDSQEKSGQGEPIDRIALDMGGGTGKAKNGLTSDYIQTDPNTDLAKKWEGWGTALKPAWEPIVIGYK